MITATNTYMNTMNKTIIGLIGFLVFSSNLMSQFYVKESLRDYKFNGKVRSCYIKTFENYIDGCLDTINPSEYSIVDFTQRKVEVINPKKEQKKLKIVRYYDENYNRSLDSIYYKNKTIETVKYNFNDKNKCIKRIVYIDDSLFSTKDYIYDLSDNLIEDILDYKGSSKHKVLYTYDSNNNNTSKYSYYNNSEFSRYVIEYNSKGQKVKGYDPTNKEIYTLFKYDKKENLICKKEYQEKQNVSRIEYSYDRNNNLIKEKSYFDNKLESSTTYIYDSSGREIQTIGWNADMYYKQIKNITKLDSKGRIIESKIYRKDCPPIINKFKYENNNLLQEIYEEPTDSYNQSYKIDYKYEKNNTLSQKTKYSYKDGSGNKTEWKISNIEDYYYNNKGKNIKIKSTSFIFNYSVTDSLIYRNDMLIRGYSYDNDYIDNTITTTYKYDDKKRLIEKKINGNSKDNNIYKYNDDTIIYESNERYSKDGELEFRISNEWKYDSYKRLVEYIYNHPSYYTKTYYFYNKKGKLKKEIYKNTVDNQVITSNYKYKKNGKGYQITYDYSADIENKYYSYDKKGNLIEERSPREIIRYEYEYFE